MTILEDRPAELLESAPESPADPAAAAPPPAAEPPLSVNLVALSSLLAVSAVAWMFAGVFSGGLARPVGLLAAVVGVGTVVLSYRTARPALLQYLVPAIGAALGAVITLASASGGQGSLPSLVTSALRSGGISHPPISFDPGWRFILVLLVTTLAGAATTAAITLRAPKLAVVVPAPLVFLGALAQPPSATLVSSVGALVLFIGSFGAAYGVELAGNGASSKRFEARRLLRGAGVLVALVAALIVVSESGFLLPKAQSHAIIPPQFPQTPPPAPQGVLFTATLPQPMPLRLGVLDVYRKVAWLTPPFDPDSFQTLKGDQQVRTGKQADDSPRPEQGPQDPTDLHVSFTVGNLAGHNLPGIASPISLPHSGFTLQYDPRTQALRVPDALVHSGLTYTEVAPAIATGKQLETAPSPPTALKDYLDIPPAPPAVQALLDKAPKANLYDRLQYVRTVFYQKVIAKGSGNPVKVPPARVDEMLAGKPATPFEIVAGEAMLARWAGVPSRIGYGYYSKTPKAKGSTTYDLRAIDGAVWLEAYFDHHGWVPIVGTPPKAQSSLSVKPKKQDPTIRPSTRLDLIVYVPVKLTTLQLLYVVLRYWLVRLLPLLLVLVLAVLFYPGVLKIARRWRRRRWAGELGPQELVAASYAELRDWATDLNIGHPAQTPLEFLTAVDHDLEHEELAWLVTRILWGDLTRDPQPGDAELAADMGASVLRRLRQASPGINRLVAFGSRASLRDPYSADIPNLWPSWAPRRRVATIVRSTGSMLRPRRVLRLVPMFPRAVMVFAVLLGLSGCGNGTRQVHVALPARIVPATLGGLSFVHEVKAEGAYAKAGSRSLVARGTVFSVHSGGVTQGDLQVASFRPQYSARTTSVKQGVLDSIAGHSFQLTRVGTVPLYVAQLPGEQLMMWFSPDGRYYELMDSQAAFTDAQQVFLSVLSYQQGGAAQTAPVVAPIDPRRGTDYSQETPS